MSGASPRPGAARADSCAEAAGLAGLLVEGALSVATLAGGLRRGSAQADAVEMRGGGGAGGGSLAVACWDGRILAAGPQPEVIRQIAVSYTHLTLPTIYSV